MRKVAQFLVVGVGLVALLRQGEVLAERLDFQVRHLRNQLKGVAGRSQPLLQDGAGLFQVVVPPVDGRQLEVQSGVGEVGLEAGADRGGLPAGAVGRRRRPLGLRRRPADAVFLALGLVRSRLDAGRVRRGGGVGHGALVVAAGDRLVDGQVLQLAVGLLVGRPDLAHQVPQRDRLHEVAALLVELGQGAVERPQRLRLLPGLLQQPHRQVQLAQRVGGLGHVHLDAHLPRVARRTRSPCSSTPR